MVSGDIILVLVKVEQKATFKHLNWTVPFSNSKKFVINESYRLQNEYLVSQETLLLDFMFPLYWNWLERIPWRKQVNCDCIPGGISGILAGSDPGVQAHQSPKNASWDCMTYVVIYYTNIKDPCRQAVPTSTTLPTPAAQGKCSTVFPLDYH